jgi:hypothetical protein
MEMAAKPRLIFQVYGLSWPSCLLMLLNVLPHQARIFSVGKEPIQCIQSIKKLEAAKQ